MTVDISIEGMMCEHCAARVRKALENVEGVSSAVVSLEEKKATVVFEGSDPSALSAAVEAVGYKVVA
jgi:Cu2+-exporting ATPase